MNEKQIRGIANSRACETLKPYRWFIVFVWVALYLIAVWYVNVVPLIILGVSLIVGYLYIYQKTNKIQHAIIQNKELQELRDEDLKGLTGDKVARTRRYIVYLLLSSIICAIPILPIGNSFITIPLCYRFPVAIFGILYAIVFILWSRKQIKIIKEQVKKELS